MDWSILIKQNIFPIELKEGKNMGKWIIYLPLVGHATLLTLDEVEELKRVLFSSSDSINPKIRIIQSWQNNKPVKVYYAPRSVNDLLNLMILPNNKCNFHCSYCYSAHGRSNTEISNKKLRDGIKYFLNPDRAKGERLTISVLGGGEPLLSWELVKSSLQYAYELNKLRDEDLPVSLVTNGSIVNEDIISFCKENNISVSVSFDIIEDVQNAQRGSYLKVKDNINVLTNNGIDVALNTVITRENVMRMDEMIEVMSQTIPQVNKVAFKTLITDSYFENNDQRKKYYHSFIDNFFAAKKLAKSKGITLSCTYLNNTICLSDRYCPGKFVITAEGDISICHCVSSKGDVLYDQFIYGEILTDGSLSITDGKLSEILSHDMNYSDRCDSCIAKWHCAGGCYADSCSLDNKHQESYCESMRYFISVYLQEKFNL